MLKGAYEQQLKNIEAGLSRMEEARTELMGKLGVYESESIRLKGEMDALASSLSDTESRQLLAAREIEGFQERLKDSSATMGMLSQNMAEAHRYIDEEGAKVAVLMQELSALKDEMDGAQTHLAGQQVRHDELVQEYDALEKLYNEKRTGLFEAISEVRSIEQRIIEVQGRIKEVNATIKRRQQDLSSCVDAAGALSQELVLLEAEISRINQSMQPIHEQIGESAAAMEAARAAIEAGTQRLFGQEKTQAEILAKLSVLSRIIDDESSAQHSPDKTRTNGKKKVSDLLSVQAGYEEAVGRSMGNALDFLIFRDHEEIVSLHGFQSKGPGFVIEQPHIEKHSQGTLSGAFGVLGLLKEFIEAHDGYADIVHALSQNMWVVEDLEAGLTLWKQGHRSCRFVTMDGMILEPTGVIRTTQEHTKYADVLKAKAEMKDLAEREKIIAMDMEQESLSLKQARQVLVDLTARNDEACAALIAMERERSAFEEKKGRILAQKERIFEQHRTYEADLAQTNELEGRLNIQVASLGESKTALEEERTRREEALKEIDERKLASRQGLTQSQENIGLIRERANDLKVLFAEKSSGIKALEESFEKRRESIVKDQARLDEIMRTRLMVEQSMEISEKQLLSAQGSTLNLRASYNALMPEYEKALGLVRSAQEESKTQRAAIDEAEKSRSEMLLKNKEFEIAYAMNLERMEGRFGNGIPEIPETFDALQARQRAGELEDRIEKMGQINFASLEAFEQAQQRWEDLHRQYEDIIKASTRLREVISNIERQSIKSFNAHL